MLNLEGWVERSKTAGIREPSVLRKVQVFQWFLLVSPIDCELLEYKYINGKDNAFYLRIQLAFFFRIYCVPGIILYIWHIGQTVSTFMGLILVWETDNNEWTNKCKAAIPDEEKINLDKGAQNYGDVISYRVINISET